MVFLSLLPISLPVQILIFLGISAYLLIFTRPIAIKKFKVGRLKTNVDSLVGKHALTVKKIAPFEKGEVKINGQIWLAALLENTENEQTARGETADKVSVDSVIIEEGQICEIVRVEGVKLIVRPLSQ
jgi:membrane protein implicated in regulation of membrane protease activity